MASNHPIVFHSFSAAPSVSEGKFNLTFSMTYWLVLSRAPSLHPASYSSEGLS